jgi:hypothetical protein
MPTQGLIVWIRNNWKYIKSNQRKFDLLSLDNSSDHSQLWYKITILNFEININYIY